MRRIMIAVVLVGFVATPAIIYAGQGFHMKCGAKPARDPRTGEVPKPCGYEARVTFGGGMLVEQITGYCRSCRKFVHVSWTRENVPDHMKRTIKVRPRPKPLGEVWDSQTGKVMTIHACPACKGPFLEIRRANELAHCPACNNPGFDVDRSKPIMAID